MTNDANTFYGAVDPDTLWALTPGDRVEFTYDEQGARRPTRYHRIAGTVRNVSPGDSHTVTVALDDVTRIRPDGTETTKPSMLLCNRNIITVTTT